MRFKQIRPNLRRGVIRSSVKTRLSGSVKKSVQSETVLTRRSGIARRSVSSPFGLTGRIFVRPDIIRTLRRTMIRFLIELLVRRIWFGQSRLYFVLNWLVMRCKLRPELEADAQQTA